VIGLALYLTGAPEAAIYDGSWTEWGGRADTPIVTGPPDGDRAVRRRHRRLDRHRLGCVKVLTRRLPRLRQRAQAGRCRSAVAGIRRRFTPLLFDVTDQARRAGAKRSSSAGDATCSGWSTMPAWRCRAAALSAIADFERSSRQRHRPADRDAGLRAAARRRRGAQGAPGASS
jgi:hypothetical protein